MNPTQVIDMHVDLTTRLTEPLFRAVIESSFMLGASTTADQKLTRLNTERDRLSEHITATEAAVEQMGRIRDEGEAVAATGDEDAMRAWTAGYESRFPEVPPTPRPLHVNHQPDEAQAMTDTIQRIVKAAYAYRVTADMGVLVQHAAQQLDDEDRFDANLAPTGCGIVRFDRPMPIVDVRGKTLLGHWLVWGPMAGGTLMAWFNDMADPDDVARDLANDPKIPDYVRRAIGRWGWIGADVTRLGDPLGAAMWLPSEEHARIIEGEGDTVTPSQNTVRYVHALWLLLNQTITTVEDDDAADRPARRRAGRMGIPDRVTVIRLRRSEGSQRAEGESMVQWSHRWITRGHWRWQACGVGRTERRRIWIDAFEKGPADRPLIITDKVYSFDR